MAFKRKESSMSRSGPQNGRAKLALFGVALVRVMFRTGSGFAPYVRDAFIAKHLGISYGTVRRVVRGASWEDHDTRRLERTEGVRRACQQLRQQLWGKDAGRPWRERVFSWQPLFEAALIDGSAVMEHWPGSLGSQQAEQAMI